MYLYIVYKFDYETTSDYVVINILQVSHDQVGKMTNKHYYGGCITLFIIPLHTDYVKLSDAVSNVQIYFAAH